MIRCGSNILELSKTVMEKFSSGTFFWNCRFFLVDRTLSRPFFPNLRFCFARVDMLGLTAWSDDLNVVLFEFLEDDTKLAQSCVHCLHHWLLRPGALDACDALGAHGSGRVLSRAHSRHTVPLFSFFCRTTLVR